MADVSVTWLGHASFRVDSPGGKRVYVDPWLGNPKCPDSEKEPERMDAHSPADSRSPIPRKVETVDRV